MTTTLGHSPRETTPIWAHAVTWWGWSIAILGLLPLGMNTGSPKLWTTVNIGYIPFAVVTSLVIIDRFVNRRFPRLTTGSHFTDAAMYAMLCYIPISAFWVEQIDDLIVYAGMWYAYVLAVFLLTTSLLVSSPKTTYTLLNSVLIGVTVASIAGLARLQLGQTSFADLIPSLDRNSVGIVFTPWVPVSLALFISTRKIRYLVITLVSILALFSIQSRTVQVGLGIVALGIPFILVPKVRTGILIIIVLLLVAVSLLLLHEDAAGIRTYPIIREIDRAVEIWDYRIRPWSPDYRRVLLHQAWVEIFSEHMVFGTGIGLSNYLHHFPRDIPISVPAAPHNSYLYILAQFGIIGSCFVLAFLIGILMILYRATRLSADMHLTRLRRAFLLGYLAVLVMLVGNQAETNPLLWLVLAIGVAVARIQGFERNQSRGNH